MFPQCEFLILQKQRKKSYKNRNLTFRIEFAKNDRTFRMYYKVPVIFIFSSIKTKYLITIQSVKIRLISPSWQFKLIY